MSDSSSTPTPPPPVTPARILSLHQQTDENLSDSTTAAERVGMVATLSRSMWEIMGRPVPSYPRSETPTRIIRLR